MNLNEQVQKYMTIFPSVGIICEIILTLFAENTEMSDSQMVKV